MMMTAEPKIFIRKELIYGFCPYCSPSSKFGSEKVIPTEGNEYSKEKIYNRFQWGILA
jgi:hypothetical protein